MRRINRFAMIFMLALSTLPSAALIAANTASAADTETALLRAPVAKPLQSAQEAIRGMKWSEALDDIKKAQQVANKTDREEYSIDELLAYVLYRQNRFDQAAAVYEHQLESPLMPPDQVAARTKAITEMYFKIGNYPKTIKWAKAYLQSDPNETRIAALLGESYFRTKDYKNAAATMTRVVAEAERIQKTPDESWLRIMDNSYYRLHDTKGRKQTLLKLVRYYQEPKDWSTLLEMYSQNVNDERLAFGYRQLMFDLNVLTRRDDYEALVFASLDAGMPGTAKQALERGKMQGVFAGPENLPGRYDRLLKSVQKQTDASRDFIRGYEKSPPSATTAHDDLLAGRIYLNDGQYDQAIDALRRGIAKGTATDIDAARIDLGIAYLKQGSRHPADRAFQAVSKKSKWSGLAELWALRVDEPKSVQRSASRQSGSTANPRHLVAEKVS